jgi:hypothetical protein
MNISKLYTYFFRTQHFKSFKNKKIDLSQFNPPFFEGLNYNYIVFEKLPPC